jgi:hypothetical protein
MAMSIARRSLLVLLVVATAAFLGGCGDDDGGTSPGSGEPALTFPLTVGTTWYFSTDVSSKCQETYTDTTTVVGTQEFEGAVFAVLQGTTAGLDETILVRQAGNALHVVPPIEIGKIRAPFGEMLAQDLEETFPWKMADFGAASGTSWTLAQLTDTVLVQGVPVQVSYHFEATSMGRGSVSVPAGDYTDAYHGQMTMTMTISNPPLQADLSTQDLWIADGVGVVKQTNIEVLDPYQGTTLTITSVLTAFSTP